MPPGLGPHTTAPATPACYFGPWFQVLMALVVLGHTLLHPADQGVFRCHCNVVPELLEWLSEHCPSHGVGSTWILLQPP